MNGSGRWDEEYKKGNNGKLYYNLGSFHFQCVCEKEWMNECTNQCFCLSFNFFVNVLCLSLMPQKNIIYILTWHWHLLLQLYNSTCVQMFRTYRLSEYFIVFIVFYFVLMHCSSHCHFNLRLAFFFFFLLTGVYIHHHSFKKDCISTAECRKFIFLFHGFDIFCNIFKSNMVIDIKGVL